MEPESHVGRRVREVRTWRGLSLTAAAGLAGISTASLSRIERGLQGVSRRGTLEAIAGALGVAPSELTGAPLPPRSPEETDGHEAVDDLRRTLRRIELGDVETPDGVTVDDLDTRVQAARRASLACDYGRLGQELPGLAEDVHALTQHSDRARGLAVPVMRMVFHLIKDLGYHDAAWQAVSNAHRAALAHGDPAWIGLVEFDRARAMTGSGARQDARTLVERAADDLTPDDGDAGQAFGMLRLMTAMQCAVTDATEDATAYADDAARVAEHTGEGVFGDMQFGPRNVALWRLSLAVESGDVERVPELAERVDVAAIPSADRQASYWADLGRGLAVRRGRETQAVAALSRAESIAPQLVHANPFVRETVGDLLRRARRDAGGRELRGMAYRLGLGV